MELGRGRGDPRRRVQLTAALTSILNSPVTLRCPTWESLISAPSPEEASLAVATPTRCNSSHFGTSSFPGAREAAQDWAVNLLNGKKNPTTPFGPDQKSKEAVDASYQGKADNLLSTQ